MPEPAAADRANRMETIVNQTLVTGATGSVGSRVVRQLRDRGMPVRAFVRDPRKAATLFGDLGDEVEIAVGDFSDDAAVRRAVETVDGVFLACANDPRQVEYEIGVIDAARAAGVSRIVKLSALGAGIGSPVAFWDWHGRIEEHLQVSGVPATVLRPTFTMANLLGSTDQVRDTARLFAPIDGAGVAMIHPTDVAATAAAALADDRHDGQTYVLTGPEAITFERVAEELSIAAGHRVEFVAVTDDAARQALVASGTPEFVAGQIVTMFGVLRRGGQDWTTDVVRAVTGCAPRHFAQFVREHAAAFEAAA